MKFCFKDWSQSKLLGLDAIWAWMLENVTLLHANIKGADQTAQIRAV